MTNKDQGEEERKFFFAMSESKLYDATIQLTVPYYDLIHKTLIDILKYHFGINDGVKSEEIEGVFLDVGAGTGKESLSILRCFPRLNVLAVDLSEQMKREFANNYDEVFGAQEPQRYAFLVQDILTLSADKQESDDLKDFMAKRPVAAVSAYCIHHFELTEKQQVYQRMYDFLDPGGIMVNIDLFNYRNREFSKYAHHFDIEYIETQFDSPSSQFVEARQLPYDTRMDMKRRWIDHMNKANLLDPVETHLEILRDLGFRAVECVFRYFQQAVIVATK